MERILIKEDKSVLTAIQKDLSVFMPGLINLKEKYEDLELGDFSDQVLKSLIATGTKPVISNYIKMLNDQLDKLNITSQLIRANSIANHNSKIEALDLGLQNLKNTRVPIYASRRTTLSLKYISFEDGSFKLSEKDKENILENYARIYIELDHEHEIFNTISELETAYNNYIGLLKKLKAGHPSLIHLSTIFSKNEDSSVSLKPEFIRYLSQQQKS